MSNDQNTVDNVTYQYKGIPLTPAIIQVLIRKLFAGKLVERQILMDEILRVHLAGGGLKPLGTNENAIRKALGDMKVSGLAENTVRGYWRIHEDMPTSSDEQLIVSEQSIITATPPEPQTNIPVESFADIDIGTGPSAVYVYYLPTYRLRAQENGEKVWPCKIGRTDRDPLSRVLSQAATALPERPRIAIIVRTSQPSAWEAALHGVLTLRGLQIEDSPGIEWFLTSPDEILGLVKSFDPKIAAQIPKQAKSSINS